MVTLTNKMGCYPVVTTSKATGFCKFSNTSRGRLRAGSKDKKWINFLKIFKSLKSSKKNLTSGAGTWRGSRVSLGFLRSSKAWVNRAL